jgi:hypothetical protein
MTVTAEKGATGPSAPTGNLLATFLAGLISGDVGMAEWFAINGMYAIQETRP